MVAPCPSSDIADLTAMGFLSQCNRTPRLYTEKPVMCRRRAANVVFFDMHLYVPWFFCVELDDEMTFQS